MMHDTRRWYFFCLALVFLIACKRDKPAETAPPSAQGDPELALLNEMIQLSPNNDSLLYLRARALKRLDAFDEAMRDLNRAMQIDSMQPAYYHLLADVLLDYARPNDSKRAIEVLELAAKRFPDLVLTKLKLSEFQLIVKKHGDALKTLDEILKSDPQNAEAYYMSGRVALDMLDTVRAVKAFQKSVQIDAENIDAWIFLGRIMTIKENPVALQYFDNAIRLDSTNVEAREFKAVYYKRVEQFDKAKALYKEIIFSNPDYSNAFFDLGTIYLDQDSLDKAWSHFDIALRTDPLFFKALYYRGVASELQGKLPEAYADYKKAHSMAPNYREAKEAKEKLEKKGLK